MKKNVSLLLALVPMCFFFSCVTKGSDNMIDEAFAMPMGSATYMVEGDFKEIEAGQWITYRKYEAKEYVLLSYSAFKDASGHDWLEVHDKRRGKEIVIQYRVSNLSGNSIDELGIVEGRYYQNDRRMDSAAMMMSLYLIPLFYSDELMPIDATVNTPVGKFMGVFGKSGSTTITFEAKTDNVDISIKDTQEGTFFYHPALPMRGVVGWNATNDRAEVIGYGFEGASPTVSIE